MIDNEVTTIQDGKLAMRTVAITGDRVLEKASDILKYVTTYVETAGGTELAVKVVQLNGGGGGGSYVEKPTIVEDLTSTSIILAEAKGNTIYKYGILTSLTVTANETADEETVIYFTAGASITTSFPNTLKWLNDNELTAEANTNYVISIVNNIAVWGTF